MAVVARLPHRIPSQRFSTRADETLRRPFCATLPAEERVTVHTTVFQFLRKLFLISQVVQQLYLFVIARRIGDAIWDGSPIHVLDALGELRDRRASIGPSFPLAFSEGWSRIFRRRPEEAGRDSSDRR